MKKRWQTLSGSTGVDQVLLGSTRFYRVLQGSFGFYGVCMILDVTHGRVTRCITASNSQITSVGQTLTNLTLEEVRQAMNPRPIGVLFDCRDHLPSVIPEIYKRPAERVG